MMSVIIEERWMLPEVDTLFELVFRLDLDADPGDFRVEISCLSPPRSESRRIVLNAARPTPISLQFESGCSLRGELKVIRSGRRAPTIGAYADLQYRRNHPEPVQDFQGLVFLREVPPLPPMPPIPPGPRPPDDDDQPIITPG